MANGMTVGRTTRAAQRVRQVLAGSWILGAALHSSPSWAAPASAVKAAPPAAKAAAPPKDPEPQQTTADQDLDSAATLADQSVAAGKPLEGAEAYSAMLAQLRAHLTPEALARGEAKRESLFAAVARVTLDVVEADAEVQLDGVDQGRTPLAAPLSANPGPHEVTLKKPGFVTLVQQLVFESGMHTQSLTLVAEVRTGKLSVTINTPQSVTELLIDNRVVGLVPWEGTLPAGKVTLQARNNDESSEPEQVEVEADITKPIVLTLVPNTGTLDISTAAVGVRITIDGHLMGIQNWRGALPVGWHRLAFAREGFITQEQDQLIKANETASVLVNTWVPDPKATGAAEPQVVDDHGLYFRLDIAPMFSTRSDGITQHCDEAASNARCAAHAPFGVSLGLRVGYRFKWLAPELWGLGQFQVSYVRSQYDHGATSDESPFYGPPRREDYVFFRYGWAAGVGVRATSPTRGVSATGGIGFGVFSMSGQYGRTSTTSSRVGPTGQQVSIPAAQSASSNSEHTYAPGLLFDGGVLLGSSPGTKLYLGVLLAVELAPTHSRVAPINGKTLGTDPTYAKYGTPGLDVASGTQWQFGPVLGFQFGY